MPYGTLHSWAFHGWFVGLDAEKTKPGKARRFTLADLYRLAILQHLVRLGFHAERARDWAHRCVKRMNEPNAPPVIHLANYDEGWVVLGNLVVEPLPGVLTRLLIYPEEITKMLQERLGIGTASSGKDQLDAGNAPDEPLARTPIDEST